jgi:hypothetical protein
MIWNLSSLNNPNFKQKLNRNNQISVLGAINLAKGLSNL